MSAKKESTPGDGIRSMKTSNLFRALNLELYVKPNKLIMGVGATAFLVCLGYISFMRWKYESLGYYPAVKENGSEQFYQKKSNWD